MNIPFIYTIQASNTRESIPTIYDQDGFCFWGNNNIEFAKTDNPTTDEIIPINSNEKNNFNSPESFFVRGAIGTKVYFAPFQTKGGSGGGSGGTYQGASPTTHTVGGLPAGTEISGRTYDQIHEKELVGEVLPTCNLSIVPTEGLRELGDDVINPQLNYSWTDGQNPNGLAVSVEYFKNSTSINLNNSPTGNSDNYQDNNTISSNTDYNVVMTDDQGRNVSCQKSYSFALPFYVGRVEETTDIFDGITQSQLLSLADVRKLVKLKSDTEDETNPINGKYMIGYPAVYGNLTTILDDLLFDTISDYDIFNYDVVGLDGNPVAYRFYILKQKTTQTNFTNHFNF